MLRCGSLRYTGHPEFCHHPACRICLAVERRRRQRAVVAKLGHCPRETLWSATLLIGTSSALSDSASHLTQFKKRLRNRICYLRARDARWKSFSVMATMELDLFQNRDLDLATDSTKHTLLGLGFPEDGDDSPVWMFHLHAVVESGEVPVDEVRKEFANLLPGHRRTLFRPMVQGNEVAVHLRRIVGYAHKSKLLRHALGHDRTPQPWHDTELSEYVRWCSSSCGRFSARRFWIGPSRSYTINRDSANVDGDVPKSVSILGCPSTAVSCSDTATVTVDRAPPSSRSRLTLSVTYLVIASRSLLNRQPTEQQSVPPSARGPPIQ